MEWVCQFPLVHIERGANKRAFRDIHDEIRAIQAKPARSPERGLIAWFPWLPTLVRRTFYRTVRRMPRWQKKYAGTVGFASVGMFALICILTNSKI